jgi:beta-phosphoglucomutase
MVRKPPTGRNNSMQQAAVIFDMDGVLALTEQAHWESWRVPAEARGIHLQYATFVSCFGRINADCVAIMFGQDVSTEESNRIADEKENAFRDIVRKNVPLAPGLLPLLEGLRARGIKLAVGSSGPAENVNLILGSGGIRQYFDAVVHGGEVKRGKPAPDVFLLAAERLGVPAARCTVVEDAPAGIRAAVAAEMMPVAVATTHDSEELKAAGAIVVSPDLKSIPIDALVKPAGF